MINSYLQTKRFFFLSLAFILLTGCATATPSRLGISQKEWHQFSPAKQDQLIASYEQTQARKKAVVIQKGKGVLSVKIENGKASLPPYTSFITYEPVSFTIQQGDCHKKIPVIAANGSDKKGKLEVCYKEDVLYLDPSPYDPALSLGALQFPYMPVWKRGFTYPGVNSTGLLKLQEVNIILHELVPADDNN